jgi:NADH-ubiquinone oxidoreductase chain 5
MYALILAIPLISSITAGLFGRFIGERGAGWFSSISIVITFMISCFAFIEICFYNSPTYLHLWNWMDTTNFTVSFSLLFDQLTAVMLIVVTSVSSLVHIYSTEYMNGDPHLPRFMSYLSLFTFFMLILVTANNILQLFIGWEGVGLCSYLLINFWYTRLQANQAAIKAMIVNRVGDAALAIGMFLIFYTYNSLDYNIIFSTVPYLLNDTINILNIQLYTIDCIGILLLAAAAGKSAQLGLHTWLPDAMEGPTPVSALIHAATMVTAGIFLVIRFSPLLEYTSISLILITIFGALTAFFAATVGLVQNDIKKVIAYSTCSQLGYMLFACGISNYSTALFHLMNHAYFKALLFLSAGSIIHALADEQDMRKYGALIKSLPFSYTMVLIGSLSLMGFPFMTGFYSKDAILELAYGHYSSHATFAHWLGTISAYFTAFYSTRLIYLTFITDTNTNQNYFNKSHENPIKISLPLVILAFGAIFVGYIFRDAFIGLGSDFFAHSIYLNPNNLISTNAEFISVTTKWTPVIFSLIGSASAFILYNFYSQNILNIKMTFRSIYIFLNNKWHFDSIYNHFIVKPIIFWGHNVSYKIIDRGVIEYIGPTGIVYIIKKFALTISALQSGYFYNYAFTIFIAATLLLIFINTQISLLIILIALYILLI